MNRILFGTSLLLAAGLCGQSAQAAPLYSVGTNVIAAPVNGTDYSALYPGPITVPFSVSDQWVDVSWAAPSTSISVGWSMTDLATFHFSGGKLPIHGVIASDVTNGAVSVLTDKTGHFRRGVGNYTTESVSASMTVGGDETGKFVSATTLLDANGNTKGTKSSQVTFTTSLVM